MSSRSGRKSPLLPPLPLQLLSGGRQEGLPKNPQEDARSWCRTCTRSPGLVQSILPELVQSMRPELDRACARSWSRACARSWYRACARSWYRARAQSWCRACARSWFRACAPELVQQFAAFRGQLSSQLNRKTLKIDFI